MSESELKLAVAQYLEYLTNQGRLYADRLQAGEIIEARGETRRRIILCREGTADFIVLQLAQGTICRVVFLECKSGKGKQSPEQGAFEKLVTEQGAEYYVVRSVEEVAEILGEVMPE